MLRIKFAILLCKNSTQVVDKEFGKCSYSYSQIVHCTVLPHSTSTIILLLFGGIVKFVWESSAIKSPQY